MTNVGVDCFVKIQCYSILIVGDFILGIDNCASIMCQNDGNCIDLWNNFKCECPFGYRGYLCDLGTIFHKIMSY